MKNRWRSVAVVGGVLSLFLIFQNCSQNKSSSENSLAQTSLIDNNIFPQGNFESAGVYLKLVLDYNKNNPSASAAVTAEAAHSGASGFRLVDTSFSLKEAESLPVDPGKSYKISFWARRVAGSDVPNPLIYFASFQRVNGNALTANMIDFTLPSKPSGWVKYETTMTPTYPSILFDFWIQQGGGNTVDIDDIRIEEVQ